MSSRNPREANETTRPTAAVSTSRPAIARGANALASFAGSGSAIGPPLAAVASPAMDAHRLQLPDVLLGERQHDGIGVDPLDRTDRDRHLALAPEVAVLEHERGDVLVAVDDESVDVAEVVAVG